MEEKLMFVEEHKALVEEDKGYEYIGSEKRNYCWYLQVKHKRCKKNSSMRLDSWRKGSRPHNGNNYCCCSYEESIAHYIEVELGLNLDDIWNWEKNNELGINPYHIKKQSNKYKIWLYCQEHDYHNYDREGNRVGYEIQCSHFYKGSRCSYCGNNKVHYKDSLAYNFPNIARMIAIEENNLTFEDCYNISCYCCKDKFYFKCLDCGKISSIKKSLNNISKRGYSCEFCSDGISIPNKFAYSLLTQLNVDFKSEYTPYYFKINQSVDFLLNDYDKILEMDGGYGNHTREYDLWRDFLNMKYGGYKTIRIDLTDDDKYRKNLFNYLKEQIINSELSNLFDLSKIDWELAWEECQKSKVVEAWNLYESGIDDIGEISRILKIDKNTVREYLKRGAECGKCSYTVEKSRKKGVKKISGKNNYNGKRVICVTTKRLFWTMTEGVKKYHMKSVTPIQRCCDNIYKKAGELEDGTPLVWRYININHNKILRGKDISKLHSKINQEVA